MKMSSHGNADLTIDCEHSMRTLPSVPVPPLVVQSYSSQKLTNADCTSQILPERNHEIAEAATTQILGLTQKLKQREQEVVDLKSENGELQCKLMFMEEEKNSLREERDRLNRENEILLEDLYRTTSAVSQISADNENWQLELSLNEMQDESLNSFPTPADQSVSNSISEDAQDSHNLRTEAYLNLSIPDQTILVTAIKNVVGSVKDWVKRPTEKHMLTKVLQICGPSFPIGIEKIRATINNMIRRYLNQNHLQLKLVQVKHEQELTLLGGSVGNT